MRVSPIGDPADWVSLNPGMLLLLPMLMVSDAREWQKKDQNRKTKKCSWYMFVLRRQRGDLGPSVTTIRASDWPLREALKSPGDKEGREIACLNVSRFWDFQDWRIVKVWPKSSNHGHTSSTVERQIETKKRTKWMPRRKGCNTISESNGVSGSIILKTLDGTE